MFKSCFGVSLYRLITFFSEFCFISALSCSFEFVVVVVDGGWVFPVITLSQPNYIVLLLGLWLLLGCDNNCINKIIIVNIYEAVWSLELFLL